MEVLMLNEDFLTENLSGESKKKFLDFCNAWSVVNAPINRIGCSAIIMMIDFNFDFEQFTNVLDIAA